MIPGLAMEAIAFIKRIHHAEYLVLKIVSCDSISANQKLPEQVY